MKDLIDINPDTGIETWHHYDELTDTTTIETIQSDAAIDRILDENKKCQNDRDIWRRGVKNEFVRVAQIPVILIHKWKVEEGLDVYNREHWDRVKRKLNSPEYSYLRTFHGRV